MTTVKKRFRKFLNTGTGMAAIGVVIEQYNGEEGTAGIYCTANISDCHKTICLEFSADGEKERLARIRKVNTLISALSEIKDVLENTTFK